MKKTGIIIIVILLLNAFGITANAEKNNTEFDYSALYESMDKQTKELLNDLGVNNNTYDDLLDLSARKIIELVIELIKGNWKHPISILGFVICICVIKSMIDTMNVNGSINNGTFNFFQSSALLLMIVVPLSKTVAAAISSMKMLSSFMLIYIPVFTGTVSASGMPISSFSYNAVMISFTELSSWISTAVILPLVLIVTVMSIFSSIGKNDGFSDVAATLKRLLTVLLSLTAGMFTGLLALKSKISIAADSIAVKGIKLLSGSVIPIVGGAIGDAFSSVLGSFSLIKNTVGAFGIVAIILIVIPSVISLLLWYFSLSIGSMVCSITGNKEASNIIKSICSCISLVNTIMLFLATVFIISTGIMLNLRN